MFKSTPTDSHTNHSRGTGTTNSYPPHPSHRKRGRGGRKVLFFIYIKQKKGKRETYKEQLEQARLLMRATTIAGQRGKQLSSTPIPDRKIIEQRPDKPRPSLCHSRAECNYIPSPTANKKGNVSSGRLRSPKELTSGKDAAGRASSRRPAGIPRLSIPSTNGDAKGAPAEKAQPGHGFPN